MYKLLILVCINYAAALESRIVGGRDARPGEVGYIVSLQKYYYHACGGSIIDEYNVITAAHCLGGDINYHHIQSGVLKIRAYDVHNVIQVRKEFIHESYNPTESIPEHDIAILRLSSPLSLNFISVTPIPLPTQGEEFRTNTWALGTGWGSVDKEHGPLSRHLQVMTVFFLPLQRCKNAYGSRFLEEIQLCVGNRRDMRKGTCSGDSGSPLVKIINGNKKLAGVLIGSKKPNGICGVNTYPDVYTKVSYYVNWIEEQLSKI